jgi:four helix bundle protein
MLSNFRTYEFAVQFARECRKLNAPRDLQDQLNRASASIALNLKEGSARHTRKDRHRFYRTSFGSFRECEAIFDIMDLKSEHLKRLSDMLGGSLNRLCRSTGTDETASHPPCPMPNPHPACP